MTNINFYVSKQDGFKHRLAIAHKLIGYALKRDLFIHIHTDNENMSQQVDDWLWIADKNSFIPHQVIKNLEYNNDTNPDNNAANTQSINLNKVTISHDYEPLEKCDYLVNLSMQRPGFFSRFIKLAEIIDNSDDVLSAGRKRYAFYRDRGYNLEYHKL